MEVTLEQKIWIGNELNDCRVSGADIERTYGINARRARFWAQTLRESGYLRHHGGRPAYLSKQDKLELRQFVSEDTSHPSPEDLKEFVFGLAKTRMDADSNFNLIMTHDRAFQTDDSTG
jgi:hypothetical protein